MCFFKHSQLLQPTDGQQAKDGFKTIYPLYPEIGSQKVRIVIFVTWKLTYEKGAPPSHPSRLSQLTASRSPSPLASSLLYVSFPYTPLYRLCRPKPHVHPPHSHMVISFSPITTNTHSIHIQTGINDQPPFVCVYFVCPSRAWVACPLSSFLVRPRACSWQFTILDRVRRGKRNERPPTKIVPLLLHK